MSFLVNAKNGPSLSLWAACGLSLCMVVCSARLSLWPIRAYYATTPVNTEANPHVEENQAWMREKARETGGDINRLSARDRGKLQAITRGHGEIALKVMAQEKPRRWFWEGCRSPGHRDRATTVTPARGRGRGRRGRRA
jgi:hypothetical protein